MTEHGGEWHLQRALGAPSECLSGGMPGSVGIGHTRWATHGEVSLANTHPIAGGDGLFVVHNGIIENYRELKKELEDEGVRFKTKTDTEVLAQFIHWHLAYSTLVDIKHAVNKVVSLIRGQYAFVVLAMGWPLTCFAEGSPLYVTENGLVASDPVAFAGHASRAYRLPEGKVFCLPDDFDKLTGRAVVVPAIPTGGAPSTRHHMLDEILQQERLIARPYEPDWLPQFPERVTLFGCGSSYNAALLGRRYFQRVCGVPAGVEYATELSDPDEDGQLWVALTQSGETRDTLNAMRAVDKKGCDQQIVLTNVGHSSATQYGVPFLLDCQSERGVAATKTFTMQAVRLYQLCHHLIEEGYKTYSRLSELALAFRYVTQTWDGRFSKKIGKFHNILYLGRGLQYPVAREGALKMMEVAYRHAQAMPASEMKHGPIALVDESVLSIVLVGHGDLAEASKINANVEEIKTRGGQVLVVCDEIVGGRVPVEDDCKFVVPAVYELLQPLVVNLVLQLAAYDVAVADGRNVDRPRNLSKSVTV